MVRLYNSLLPRQNIENPSRNDHTTLVGMPDLQRDRSRRHWRRTLEQYATALKYFVV